jgi:MSHA type pilus biogenesis protein MshL
MPSEQRHPSVNTNDFPKSDRLSQVAQTNQVKNESVTSFKKSSIEEKSNVMPKFKNLSPLETQKVSLSFVDEDYRAIFQGLAHAGGFNLVILPSVVNSLGEKGRITANFTEMSLKDILNSICRILDIYWKVTEGTLYIEINEQKILQLDFLANIQNTQYTIGGDVLGGGGSGGGSAGNNNVVTPLTGNFKLEGQMDRSVSDIYSEIENVVSSRLNISSQSSSFTSSQASSSSSSSSGQTSLGSGITGQRQTAASASQSAFSSGGGGSGEDGSYFLNKQTGTLMIKGRPSALKDIEIYIETLRSKYNRYVLIDARILEVELSKEYRLGIDWKTLEGTVSKTLLRNTKTTVDLANPFDTAAGIFSFSRSDKYFDMSVLVNALQEFGQIRTLSNPRLKAMNGQTAVISVGQSISYLKELTRDINDTSSSSINNFDYEVQISSIFDGILLGVTPLIQEDGKVNLHVVPIKSELIQIDERTFGESVSYSLPRVNLREASTVLRVKSGEIAVLGGFIKERKEKLDSGMPVLQKLPVAGKLFRYETEENKLIEMVILLDIQVYSGE